MNSDHNMNNHHINNGNNTVNVHTINGVEKVSLNELIPQVNQINLKNKSRAQILRYLKTVTTNKKQKQSNSPKAGKKHVVHSPGTNRGETRQKYMRIGGSTRTMGAPNNVGGRAALRYMKNQTKLKMNKKEKKQIISTMIYDLILKSELHMVDSLATENTSSFFNLLKRVDSSQLASYIENNKRKKGIRKISKLGPVLLLNENKQKYFLNHSKVLNLRKGTNFFGIYNGSILRKVVVFEKQVLKDLINKYLIK